MRKMGLIFAMIIICALPLMAQESKDSEQNSNSKLLVVGTAHLDTQWRWTVKKSIEEFISVKI